MIDEKKLIEELKKWMNDTAYLKEKYSGATQFKDRTGENIMYAHAEIAHDVISEVIGKINKQQKVGEWIPCSERMPEESGTYIVNAIENHIVHVTFAKFMPRMKKWNLTGSRSYWKVTSWMPLPEPYKQNDE